MYDLLLWAREGGDPLRSEGWYYVVVTVSTDRLDRAIKEAKEYLKKISTDCGRLQPSLLPVEYIAAYTGKCGSFDHLIGLPTMIKPDRGCHSFVV